MSILSDRIDNLCKERGITGYRLCKDIGISPNVMTELRSGRRNGINAKNANKIADYFGVTVGYLLGEEEKEKPAGQKADGLTKEDIDLLLKIKMAPEAKKRAILELLKGWEEE